MRSSYRLVKSERNEKGVIKHEAVINGGEAVFRYHSVRIGLTSPSVECPSFFIVAGEEVEDVFYNSERRGIRVIQEHQHEGLALDSLFDMVTDSYFSNKCDAVYVDGKREDFKLHFWEFLDRRNIRNLNIYDVPYQDLAFRFGLVGSYNESGDLLVDKGSSLFEDLKGASRSSLKDDPEVKFYRLNALSYLIAGFDKYSSRQLLDLKNFGRRQSPGWMG